MSAILQGADKAYLREYNESEDERRLDALQDSIGSIRKATKGGKYLGSDVIDIMVQVQGFAEKLGIDPDELEYAENQVREAMNNLESAIYGLEEPFEDAIRALQNKIDDSEELDEMFDNDAFNNIFKDKKDRGSMENPEPKHFELAKSLEELLKRHDWTYNYSDDSRAWSKGKKEADEIRRIKRTLSDLGLEAIASEMYDKHSPFKKDELEEMYDEKAFNNIFKDRKDKGSMEKPKSKSLPKDTGMYNQPNKAERDKRENDNIDEESKGLWANIHAKRKRGEKPAKKGDKAYPKTLDIDEEKQRLDPKCWDGYKKQGTKMKGDTRVNNCVPKESRIASSLRMVAEEYEREMEEGNGRLRGIAAGALLIGSLMGLNNKMAQEVYDNSHQLQQLTQIYQIAQERGDEEKMKDVKRRISNHKTRLDLGKGDVDFDGLPGNDDIKDIDYLNQPK